jgi:hypothetical protein
MRSPFPGMDPYLEHPALWPDVHNRLIAAIADVLAPQVAPRYYVRLERRTYLFSPDDAVFIGRPDVSVLREAATEYVAPPAEAVWVTVPALDEVAESYLEIRAVDSSKVVTALELLSPANKLHARGREQYLEKRTLVLATWTNLVEIDLLRAGEPMPVRGKAPPGDYRVLISRRWQRPRAQLYCFGLRQRIPEFTVPVMQDEPEPALDLGAVVHAAYDRARYDLELDYSQPPDPPLSEADAAWARERVARHISAQPRQ